MPSDNVSVTLIGNSRSLLGPSLHQTQSKRRITLNSTFQNSSASLIGQDSASGMSRKDVQVSINVESDPAVQACIAVPASTYISSKASMIDRERNQRLHSAVVSDINIPKTMPHGQRNTVYQAQSLTSLASSQKHSDSTTWAVAFTNRPFGTPLTPIVERNSCSTLSSKASNIPGRRRFTPNQIMPIAEVTPFCEEEDLKSYAKPLSGVSRPGTRTSPLQPHLRSLARDPTCRHVVECEGEFTRVGIKSCNDAATCALNNTAHLECKDNMQSRGILSNTVDRVKRKANHIIGSYSNLVTRKREITKIQHEGRVALPRSISKGSHRSAGGLKVSLSAMSVAEAPRIKSIDVSKNGLSEFLKIINSSDIPARLGASISEDMHARRSVLGTNQLYDWYGRCFTTYSTIIFSLDLVLSLLTPSSKRHSSLYLPATRFQPRTIANTSINDRIDIIADLNMLSTTAPDIEQNIDSSTWRNALKESVPENDYQCSQHPNLEINQPVKPSGQYSIFPTALETLIPIAASEGLIRPVVHVTPKQHSGHDFANEREEYYPDSTFGSTFCLSPLLRFMRVRASKRHHPQATQDRKLITDNNCTPQRRRTNFSGTWSQPPSEPQQNNLRTVSNQRVSIDNTARSVLRVCFCQPREGLEDMSESLLSAQPQHP